jgi:hypothetical protein
VKANREPEIPGTAKSETKEKTDESRCEHARPLLATISQMDQSEGARQNNGGRPKADTAGQRELRIAPEQELLEQADEEKHQRPERRESH